jgi:hypothetical protein
MLQSMPAAIRGDLESGLERSHHVQSIETSNLALQMTDSLQVIVSGSQPGVLSKTNRSSEKRTQSKPLPLTVVRHWLNPAFLEYEENRSVAFA